MLSHPGGLARCGPTPQKEKPEAETSTSGLYSLGVPKAGPDQIGVKISFKGRQPNKESATKSLCRYGMSGSKRYHN